MTSPPQDMLWSGWGDPARATRLPDSVRGLLRDLLGVKPLDTPPASLADIAVPASRLDDAVRAALAAAVGDEHVRVDDESRIRHTGGKSTPDLLRIRRGEAGGAPDAVVLPGSADEVLAVLWVCTEHRVAVVPSAVALRWWAVSRRSPTGPITASSRSTCAASTG